MRQVGGSMYHWMRTDAVLRAKVAGAKRLLELAGGTAIAAERARLQAALHAREEHLRVHQMNKPTEGHDRD